jgi:hypothetical protein
MIENADSTFFHDSNRMLIIMMTVYSKRLDFWSCAFALYEFHLSEQVEITVVRSQPMVPNLYELESEQAYLFLDALSSLLILVYFTIVITLRVKKIIKFTEFRLFNVLKVLFNLLMISVTLCSIGYSYQLADSSINFYKKNSNFDAYGMSMTYYYCYTF